MSSSIPRVSLTGRFCRFGVYLCLGASVVAATAPQLRAQSAARGGGPQPKASPKAAAPPAGLPEGVELPTGVPTPVDYIIGSDDVLSVIFWRDKDMSTDVIVRPDGKITLPLLNDIDAAGLTPNQLREKLTLEAGRFLEEPAATVVVKQINSRKVFITGEIAKPGPYPLTTPLTVLQLISIAGGLQDYARREDIVIMRTVGGNQVAFPFDYTAVTKRKKPQQNILLKPGDTVIVP